jgi:hypothetical protein
LKAISSLIFVSARIFQALLRHVVEWFERDVWAAEIRPYVRSFALLVRRRIASPSEPLSPPGENQ